MFDIPLDQWLQFLRLQGHELQVPTPPDCEELWGLARKAGIRLGKLFVLSAPLHPFTGGTHNPTTGDIWVLQDEQEPRRTRHILLHELAHAEQTSHEPPRTIHEDWEREAATWQKARELACEWGHEDWLTEEELAEELATIEMFRDRHLEAAVLAGSQDPARARAAYTALALVGLTQQWDQETLEAALWGYSEDAAVKIAAVTIDRQGLRGSWSLIGDEEQSAAEGLDLPQSEASASLLRYALAALSREQQAMRHKFVRQRWGDEQRDLCFLSMTSQSDLKTIIGHAMKALLTYPEGAAFARWTVFSTQGSELETTRVYRLTVDYRVDNSQRPPSAELWLLVEAERERDLVAEGAWQMFIRSWLKVTGVRQEALKEGLQELWGVLGYAGLPGK